jgi:hypothetical protein
MRKYYIAAPILFLLLFLALRPSFERGFYAGVLVCRSSDNCLHEIGHKMDTETGYPSRSEAFGDALRIHFVGSCKFGFDKYAELIFKQGGVFQYDRNFSVLGMERFSSPQAELYADIYMTAGGDVSAIPPLLRPFYSTDKRYTDLYNCLMSQDAKLCGTAIHMEKEGK